jgi:membrane-bound ClpP family serine protease
MAARQRWEKATLSASAMLLLLIGSGLGHNPWQPSWISWMLLISIGLLLPLGEPLAMRPGAMGRPHLAFVGLGFLLLLWQALVHQPGLETAVLASVWLAYRLVIAAEVLWLTMQTRRCSPPLAQRGCWPIAPTGCPGDLMRSSSYSQLRIFITRATRCR